MSKSYYDDDGKLDYPAADRLVVRYIRERGHRPQATSVDVLRWSDYPNDHHNRRRVFDSLSRLAEPSGERCGRTVFQLPDEVPNP